MEEKSQLWFACSPFIQVSFLFKQKEGRENKRNKRRNQGMEFLYGKYGNLFRFVYGKYGFVG